MQTSEMVTQMQQALGRGGGPFGRIAGWLESWAIADQALREIAAEFPLWADKVMESEVWKQSCFPLVPFQTDELYYSHAIELGHRVVNGESLTEPTNAEIAMFMSEVSLDAGVPIINDAAVVYYDAFMEAFAHRPDILQTVSDVMDYPPRASWSGAAIEVRNQVVRKLLQNKRGDF